MQIASMGCFSIAPLHKKTETSSAFAPTRRDRRTRGAHAEQLLRVSPLRFAAVLED